MLVLPETKPRLLAGEHAALDIPGASLAVSRVVRAVVLWFQAVLPPTVLLGKSAEVRRFSTSILVLIHL